MGKVPTQKLNTGAEIPVFGLGTWKSKPGEVKAAVENAIDAGYRHIDCAFIYGNEPEVGEAIAGKIKEGVVKREELFITTKLWNTFHRSDLVENALKASLKNLQVSYVDLYLIHWPFGYKEDAELFPRNTEGAIITSDVDYMDAWKEMEKLFKSGVTKAIGVSNFNSEQLDRILKEGSVPPAMVQVECHPYLNQAKLIDFCKAKGILFTAYSPLGSPDRPWAKPEDPKLLDDPKLVKLAKDYGKSPAQIVLRWNVQRGLIVIPKTVTKARLVENADVFDFQLKEEDMKYVDGLECAGRCCVLEWIKPHQYYPFNIPF